MNSIENIFERGFWAIQEREKIKEEIDKIVGKIEKECQFEVLKEFVRYLGSLESIFIDYSGNRRKIEEEYIKLEIKSFSISSGIDPSAFLVVLSMFKTQLKAVKIKAIANVIEEKCPNDLDDYQEFIDHLEKVFTAFEEGKDSDEEVIKKKLIEEKIRQLSSDGEPSREELERISVDFMQKLVEEGIIKIKK